MKKELEDWLGKQAGCLLIHFFVKFASDECSSAVMGMSWVPKLADIT